MASKPVKMECSNTILDTITQSMDQLFVGERTRGPNLGSPLLELQLPFDPQYFCAGITKIDECLCVVGLNQPLFWMYSLKTNSSKLDTLPALQAQGMTTVGNNSNKLVITNFNQKLHFVTIDPEKMNITERWTKDIPFAPRTVVYDHSTDKLIIANWSDKQIVICSKTGDVENRITVKPEPRQMWCALPSAQDAYIVLDNTGSGKVFWVNQSGDVTHTYGAGAGEDLCNPWHALQDSQGRLLVADTDNHCICLINNQKFSHDVGMIKHPSCLYRDEAAGTLYISYYSRGPKLNMYKWPFTHLKCCLLNAQSVVKKGTQIATYVTENDLDFLALTETWLNGTERDDCAISPLRHAGYQFSHEPRVGRRGGGVAVLCKTGLDICSLESEKIFQAKTFELIERHVSSHSTSFHLALLYCPSPDKAFLELENLFKHLSAVKSQILLAGDFNIHMDKPEKPNPKKLSTLLKNYGLKQHVVGKTHREGHALDLIITRDSDSSLVPDSVQVNQTIELCDHFPVHWEM